MALDPKYVLFQDLQGIILDKDTGLPLANGVVRFWRDSDRSTPKSMFILSGSPPNYTYTDIGSEVDLSSIGTYQYNGNDVALYFYPYITVSNPDIQEIVDLYYITVESDGAVAQFTREAWPNITSLNDAVAEQFPIQNQIANPQFTEVLINEGISTTYTVSAATNQVFEFAPNWDFVISGTGTVIVERIAISGNDQIVTSPPYVLDISVSVGVTKCWLRQRYSANSGLWASTSNVDFFLSGLLIALNMNVGDTAVQMFYEESSGGSPITIVDESFDNTGYELIQGSTVDPIPLSTNTDDGVDGYVDIYLSFSANTHVRVSSIQVIPTEGESTATTFLYDVNSSNRELANMGDYYLPRLQAKQINSLITGWDFPLNPYQFGTSGNLPLAAASSYITDQTIAVRGAVGAVAFSINAITGGIKFSTSGTSDFFYIMQYLSGAQAKKILGTRLSVNVFGFKDNVSDAVTMRVYLFRGSSAATFPTLPATLGTSNTAGIFTLSASDWTEIERSGLGTATASIQNLVTSNDLNTGNYDYSFTGWEITDSTEISDTDKFAIIVTFGYTDASTDVTINSISVVPGDIPTRPAEKTIDETLRECQYYYEKSYDSDVTPATVTPTGAISVALNYNYADANYQAGANAFTTHFKTVKRIAPTYTIYSPNNGASGNIYALIYDQAVQKQTTNATFASFWNTYSSSIFSTAFIPSTGTEILSAAAGAIANPVSWMVYHYEADARLGVV